MKKWNPSIHADQTEFVKFIIEQSNNSKLLKLRTEALQKHLIPLGFNQFSGYDCTRNEIWAQINAFYDLLLTHDPKLNDKTGHQTYYSQIAQEIRTIDEIFNNHQVNSIDIVNLMAILLMNIGLNPIVLLVGDIKQNQPLHALIGFWLDDVTADSFKVTRETILQNLGSLGVCELSGILQQPSLPFNSACKETRSYIPLNLQDNLKFPFDGDSEKPKNESNNLGILYGIDIRKYLIDYTKFLPIISIMGAKGGVGKTIISARIAELIAETGTNVLLLDYDIENAGTTVFHKKRFQHGLTPIKTIYEHIIPYAPGFNPISKEENLNLWDVTPVYLNDSEFGRVYLIPARSEGDIGAFEAIANIDYKDRNEILAKITDELIARIGMAEAEIGCVIIDCGAGNNPVYSAALFKAKYGIVIATPEDVCIQQLNSIKSELRTRFPKATLDQVHLILNRVRNQLDIVRWKHQKPKGYIGESSDLQEDYYNNTVYFDLGYDTFSINVRDAFAQIFEKDDQKIIPDEFHWLKKWIDILQKHQLPQKLLLSKSFKRKVLFNKIFPFVAVAILFLSTLFFYKSMTSSSFSDILSISNNGQIKIDNNGSPSSSNFNFDYKRFSFELERVGITSSNIPIIAKEIKDNINIYINSTNNNFDSIAIFTMFLQQGVPIDSLSTAYKVFKNSLNITKPINVVNETNFEEKSNPKENGLSEASNSVAGIRLLALLVFCSSIPLLIFSIWRNKIWLRRKKLLQQLVNIDNDEKSLRDFVLRLINRGRKERSETSIKQSEEINIPSLRPNEWFKPEINALKWLKQIMKLEIETYRKSEKSGRSESDKNKI